MPPPAAFTVATQPPFDEPLVSVTVLAYRHEAFIAEALDGILMQEVTFPVEVIVGDDASPDRTPDILRDYAARYPHVFRLHLHAVNGAGVPGRVNNVTNLRSTRGRYVALHDGDDVWLRRDKLARQVAFLEAHPDYVLVAQAKNERHWPEGDVTLEALAATGRYSLYASSLLLRREALLPLPEWFDEVLIADYFLVCHVLRSGPGHVTHVEYVHYRRHDASFGAATERRPWSVIECHDDYRRLPRYFPEFAAGRGARHALLDLLYTATLRAVRRRHGGPLLAALRRARLYGPGEHLAAAGRMFAVVVEEVRRQWALRRART